VGLRRVGLAGVPATFLLIRRGDLGKAASATGGSAAAPVFERVLETTSAGVQTQVGDTAA